MSFNAEKNRYFREEVVVVELHLDQNDPAIDFSDEVTSYNTPKTTINPLAYNPQAPKKVYRFSDQQLDGSDIQYFPNVSRVSQTTPVLSIGENIGTRASVSVSIDDFITNDAYELPAPYNDRRVTGSFWGKLLARNFVDNRKMFVYRGYRPRNFDKINFQREEYIIKDISRGKDGSVNIKGVDPLFFTNESKAKMPLKSNGKIFNAAGINSTATSVSMFTSDILEYGQVGEAGIARINDELVDYTVTSTTSQSVNLSLVTRGAYNTIASDHDNGDLGQKCYVANNRNVVDIIRDCFGFTNIDQSYIPQVQWETEKAGPLSTYNLTTILSKPTEVKKVLSDMVRHSGSILYWDTVASRIVLKGNPEFKDPELIVDEFVYEQDSVTISEKRGDQVTRASINYAKRNYVLDDKENNYRKGFITIDDIAESDAQFADVSESKVINSNWLTSSNNDEAIAFQITSREVARKSKIPFETKFTIDSQYIGVKGNVETVTGNAFSSAFSQVEFGIDGNDILNTPRVWLGSFVQMTNHILLGPDGGRLTYIGQITKLEPKGYDKWEITILSISTTPQAEFDYEITQDAQDLTLTDFYPPIVEDPPRPTVILISSGVVIGATSTTNAALDTGLYPDGLLIINRGEILGAGGNGKNAGVMSVVEPEVCAISFPVGTINPNGGNALEVSTPNLVIDNGGIGSQTGSAGFIKGGGGGGADTAGYESDQRFPDPGPVYPQPGAGGQGFIGGTGGQGNEAGGPDGQDGSINGPGLTPAADGGTWGEDGQSTQIAGCGLGSNLVVRTGGKAGNAIVKNGNTVTITDGNNTGQIKGPIV
jgi:hypothetical protein